MKEKISSKVEDLIRGFDKIKEGNPQNEIIVKKIEGEEEIKDEENFKLNENEKENFSNQENLQIIDDASENKSKDLKHLVYNCMGVLYSIKQKGEINYKENKFASLLLDKIYDENPQEFYSLFNLINNK